MSNIAISFEDVSKMYRLGLVGTGTLAQDLNRWWKMNILGQEDPYLRIGQTNDRSTKGTSDFVYALKDINFQIEQGDVVGIIGKNGAGKSTLLKLLSRITAPTTGQIKTRGRLASLLEVGTGFHPELTGRENIFMNGSIMGMTKAEISSKLDEIVDFAGVERYIDTPTKRYSSGMTVRLGFAVAAFLEPEILVVDEVLAVGDAEFQKKAIGKMQDVASGHGRTVLFVSHNMSSVRALCKNGIVLKDGMIDHVGTADECVDYYINSNTVTSYVDHQILTDAHRTKNFLVREFDIYEVRMHNDVNNMSTEEPIHLELLVKRNNPSVKKCKFCISFLDTSFANVGSSFSEEMELPSDVDVMKVDLVVRNHRLPRGVYRLNIHICNFDYCAKLKNYDVVYGVLSFEVKYLDAKHTQPFATWPRLGVVYEPCEVAISAL